MKIKKSHIKIIIVVSFFISIIPFSYKIYEHSDGIEIMNGAALVTPRLLNTQSEEEWRAAARSEVIKSNMIFRLCDRELSVYRPIGSSAANEMETMELDIMIGGTLVDVICKRSFAYTMATYSLYFFIPFVFIILFGVCTLWAVGRNKKATS